MTAALRLGNIALDKSAAHFAPVFTSLFASLFAPVECRDNGSHQLLTFPLASFRHAGVIGGLCDRPVD